VLARPLTRPVRSRGPRLPSIVDVAAPAIVVGFLALRFGAFSLVVNLPGAVSSVLIPATALGILAITPSAGLRRIPVSLPLLAFLCWLALSLTWSVAPYATRTAIRTELPALVLVAAVAGTIEPQRLMRIMAFAMSVITIVSLLISIAWPPAREVVVDAATAELQHGFRGLFIHKNLFGTFAIYTLAVVLPLRFRWRRWVVVAVLAAAMGTRSATAGGGMFAVAFVWSWITVLASQRSPRARSALATFGVLSAIIGLLLSLRVLPVLLSVYGKDVTFSGRTTIWAESLRLVAERPFQGYGFGALFSDPTPPITVELHRRLGFYAAHAHNRAVATLLDVGVIGLGLFAVYIASAAATVARALRTPDAR